jgi:hypothetical protein
MKKHCFIFLLLMAILGSIGTTIFANSGTSNNAKLLLESERDVSQHLCYTILQNPIWGYLKGDYVCDSDGEECPEKVANFMFPNGHYCVVRGDD